MEPASSMTTRQRPSSRASSQPGASSGQPQWTHAFALLDTASPHSGHLINAMSDLLAEYRAADNAHRHALPPENPELAVAASIASVPQNLLHNISREAEKWDHARPHSRVAARENAPTNVRVPAGFVV